MIDNKNKIINVLFKKPEYHFHIRELARETKLHPSTISKLTKELEDEGIVKRENYKKVLEVFCDFDSLKFKRKKQLFNIDAIYGSGLVDELISFYNHPIAIILFGSFFRGEDWSTSDIDIAVISPKDETPDLTLFENFFSRKIHLLSFPLRKVSGEFYNNLINGFVLYGFLDNEEFQNLSFRRKSKKN